jgi:hypothetical protein
VIRWVPPGSCLRARPQRSADHATSLIQSQDTVTWSLTVLRHVDMGEGPFRALAHRLDQLPSLKREAQASSWDAARLTRGVGPLVHNYECDSGGVEFAGHSRTS